LDQLPPAYDLGEPARVISVAPPASAPVMAPIAEAVELNKQSAPPMSARKAPVSPATASENVSGWRQAESAAKPAPVLSELNANDRVAAKQLAEDAAAPKASLADSAFKAESHASPDKAKTALSLEQQLRALLQLQRSGATQAAAAELERLQRLYPEHDLAAQLAKLRAGTP
jgi:hypothetical protein